MARSQTIHLGYEEGTGRMTAHAAFPYLLIVAALVVVMSPYLF